MKAIEKLVAWRILNIKAWSVPEVVESLSCEGLKWEDCPPSHERALVAFRHLRQDRRARVVAKLMEVMS